MRVLVTGARGQVGYELLRLAPEGVTVVGFGSAELDITDAGAVEQAVDREGPDLIINAAAYTAVDKAESNADRAYAVNCDGVANLARAVNRSGIPLLHISTDYVFSGDSLAPYCEDDETAPSGVYGASKLAGEQVLEDICPSHLILRTSWVFGAHGHNFVKTMLRLGAERDEISIVEDQVGCPTSARSIAMALWAISAQYKRVGTLDWGVYHYAGTPACSWHDFANSIFSMANNFGLLGGSPTVCPISTQDYPTPARRPKWSVMDSSRLEKVFGVQAKDWHGELEAMLKELSLPYAG